MSTNHTGGPAFPIFPETGTGHASAFQGMTLRDYFAADAMKAYLILEKHQGARPGSIAFIAYQMADAMLKAREA